MYNREGDHSPTRWMQPPRRRTKCGRLVRREERPDRLAYKLRLGEILFVVDIRRWLHPDAVRVKSEPTGFVVTEIEESENKHLILGDDASAGECVDVSDSDST